MLERGKMERGVFEIVDTESLVPPKHLLRKIDAAVDFTRIYDMVEPLYCLDNGRPSTDPVVLFKMVLIQHLYGLPSLRRTAEEVSANMCYRWFLGYRLQEETPHFSTISYNFRHRFTTETVDQIFAWILSEIAEAGYLSPSVVVCGWNAYKSQCQHEKADQGRNSRGGQALCQRAHGGSKQDREAHEKKPFFDEDDQDCDPPVARKKRDNTSKKKLKRRKKEAKMKTATKSVTDPDSGLFVRATTSGNLPMKHIRHAISTALCFL